MLRTLARKPIIVEDNVHNNIWEIKVRADPQNEKWLLWINGLLFEEMQEFKLYYENQIYRSEIYHDWDGDIKKSWTTIYFEQEAREFSVSHDTKNVQT